VSEFFSVRTVSDALAGFRPAHRTATGPLPIAEAVGRMPASGVAAPASLPGFARSAVDGYAVAAMATHGAGESLPAYLRVIGAVEMGRLPNFEVGGDTVAAIPTGGALPPGADAVAMIEHTADLGDGRIELSRPLAAGDNVIKPGDDVAKGAPIVDIGRPLRPQEIGLLAASGITEVDVHDLPLVAVISTGDEVVPADTEPPSGKVRDANSYALAALVHELGGRPWMLGIVADDPGDLERVCRIALDRADVLVVSAGSSVGARDATATVMSRLGSPGIWCHGLALKPGKPTLLADLDGRPAIGLPGNPVSALVVMRLIGGPVIGRAGGSSGTDRGRRAQAVLERNVPSQAGRLDVIQVRLEGGRAIPLFGKASQLSIMTQADGYVVIPEPVQGLAAGSDVTVEVYR
jgi:molybdopterin molybdotransferase